MAKDKSGIGYSCPFLDEVISNLKEVESRIENEVALEYINDCYNPIEKARAIHDELREWGNSIYNELQQANSDFEYYEKEYNKAIEEIEQLKAKINELEHNQ